MHSSLVKRELQSVMLAQREPRFERDLLFEKANRNLGGGFRGPAVRFGSFFFTERVGDEAREIARPILRQQNC
jgi:hypothetical protein